MYRLGKDGLGALAWAQVSWWKLRGARGQTTPEYAVLTCACALVIVAGTRVVQLFMGSWVAQLFAR